MTPTELLVFMRRHRLAVQASVSSAGAPQAAVVGIGITDRFEIVFDTLATTRKCANLRRDGRVAFVLGWDEERTVQYEGIVDEPAGAELERVRRAYFVAHPEGPERLAWAGITYLRATPTWVRFSDFREGSAGVMEFRAEDLR